MAVLLKWKFTIFVPLKNVFQLNLKYVVKPFTDVTAT